MEHPGDNVGGEHLAGVVEFARRGIEEAAGGRKLVLDVGKFCLQLQEALVRLEFRVSLQRDLEPGKRTGQRLVGSDLFVDRSCAHRGGTGSSHPFKSLLFVGRVTLDRIHQLRHQVVTLFELHFDVRKRVLAVVAELHETIVHRNGQYNQNDYNDSDNNSYCHKDSSAKVYLTYIIENRSYKTKNETEILVCQSGSSE